MDGGRQSLVNEIIEKSFNHIEAVGITFCDKCGNKFTMSDLDKDNKYHCKICGSTYEIF